jgi:putative hemolysin
MKSYRSKPVTLQLLWRGIGVFTKRFTIDLMFGCASLVGTDPRSLALPLSYLHHFHAMPEGTPVRARPERYVDMNLMPKDAIDVKEALRSLPPLIKGYVRAGACIGDGAVIDPQFDTTDVFIYVPVSTMDGRYRSRFRIFS